MSCKFEERWCPCKEGLDSDGLCMSHCEVGIACHREMRLLSEIGRLTPEAIYISIAVIGSAFILFRG